MVAHGGGGTQLNYIYLVDLFASILYGIQALLVSVGKQWTPFRSASGATSVLM